MQQSRFIWQGVGSLVSSGLSFWNQGVNKNESNGIIVYGIGGESKVTFNYFLYIKCGSYLLVERMYLFIGNVVCECNFAF